MKKTILTTALAFTVTLTAKAQNVHIPDANFKACLVADSSINTNGDTEIQVSEAEAFTGTIICGNMNISDLTGIEAFTALTGLYCSNNQLTSIDVSNNSALIWLNFSKNQLTSLNVANGNNTAISDGKFIVQDNPDLSCIQVDDAAWSTANWTNIDATASFSEDCGISGIHDLEQARINLYPNPATRQLNIELDKAATVYIVDITGKRLVRKQLNAGNNSIDVSNLTSGMYFLQFEKVGVLRFVKE